MLVHVTLTNHFILRSSPSSAIDPETSGMLAVSRFEPVSLYETTTRPDILDSTPLTLSFPFPLACGAVGHGGHYHSQSPEAYLAHTPGLTVVMPRGPVSGKGLLLSAIRSKDPVIFLEPKALYRASVEDVPVGDYMTELGKAHIMREGGDVTVVGWGGQLRVLETACNLAKDRYGIECELIDLQTILPWDKDTVEKSVLKTGKLVVSHEAPITSGFGAEVVASIQERCFWSLEAPIQRVCGYDTPFPLVFEKYYVPDELKNLEAIRSVADASN